MYEKTIGNLHRIFNIVIPNTPTLVLSLLNAEDLAEYNNLVKKGVPVDPVFNQPPADKLYQRIPVDGYILSYDNYWYMGWTDDPPPLAAFETIPVDERCTFPVSFWLNKVYIYAPTNINGIIRIFFS